MRTMRIAMVAALLIASGWTLQVAGAKQTEKTPANENRKEQSYMTNEEPLEFQRLWNGCGRVTSPWVPET